MIVPVQSMALLAIKQLQGEELLPDRDGYIPHGRRKNYFAEKPGAGKKDEKRTGKKGAQSAGNPNRSADRFFGSVDHSL